MNYYKKFTLGKFIVIQDRESDLSKNKVRN